MNEQPTSQVPLNEGQNARTGDTGRKRPERPAIPKGKVDDTAMSVDFTADDIVDLEKQHDKAQAEVDKDRDPSDEPHDGDEPPVDAEDESELEAVAANDVRQRREMKEDDWLDDPRYWVAGEFTARAEELKELFKGLELKDVRRIASNMAAELLKEMEDMRAFRKSHGKEEGPVLTEEEILKRLLEEARLDDPIDEETDTKTTELPSP